VGQVDVLFPQRKAKEGRWITASTQNLTLEERRREKGDSFADPFALAELYHESSKNYPGLLFAQMSSLSFECTDDHPRTTDRWVDVPAIEHLRALDVPLGEALLNRLYWIEGGADLRERVLRCHPQTDLESHEFFDSSQEAAVQFYLVADFRFQADKYGPRAYRLATLEAGHAAFDATLTNVVKQPRCPVCGV
jgi:hypothetical protein